MVRVRVRVNRAQAEGRGDAPLVALKGEQYAERDERERAG